MTSPVIHNENMPLIQIQNANDQGRLEGRCVSLRFKNPTTKKIALWVGVITFALLISSGIGLAIGMKYSENENLQIPSVALLTLGGASLVTTMALFCIPTQSRVESPIKCGEWYVY